MMSSEEVKPRILLITRNLPPLVGGMEKLMLNLANGLAEYADVTIVGPTGCSAFFPDDLVAYEFAENAPTFILSSTWKALRLCHSHDFDIIIGGSGLVSPTLRILGRIFGCKTLVYLHGLDLVVNNIIYQSVFTPCHRRLSRVLVNSSNTLHLAMEKGIVGERISIVNPGTNIPQTPDAKALSHFRENHNIDFEKTIVFVGRMTKRKGLSAFVKHSLPEILRKEPRCGLVIVGDEPQDSLNQLGEGAAVIDVVSSLENRDRVRFLGKLSDADLNVCYAASAVQIFPLIDIPGDVEGFGMVAIEAAACGTPTVAFNLGGVADAISSDNGHLVAPGHYEQFTTAVLAVLQSEEPTSQQCIRHGEKYCWDNFHRNIKHEVLQLATA